MTSDGSAMSNGASQSQGADCPPADPASREKARREQEVYEKAAPSATIVHDAIEKEAREELARSTAALAWSGLAAGLSMGFSLIAEGLLRAHLPDEKWRPLISKLGYSVGFVIVVLGRQQLFTENTLTPVLPLLRDRSRKMLLNVARLWGVVLLTNLIGTAAIALALARTRAFDDSVQAAFLQLGHDALVASASAVALRAIFAGWLIALMVWLLPAAEAARFWVIMLLTYLIGLGKLSHVIAGSVETLYVVMAGEESFWTYLGRFLLPCLIGNILGGVALVAALNHAQVMAGKPPAGEQLSPGQRGRAE